MLRSMYSGISGMKANQTKMDVVGNNVANVGTTSFKKSSVRFTDALNQSMIYSSAPSEGIGGVNPGQVGIGVKVSGIFKNMGQGSMQTTGRPTDLAIDGDGFFAVELGDGSKAYTRDGSFSLDRDGYLVTSSGFKVLDSNEKPIKIPTSVKYTYTDPKPDSKPVTVDNANVLSFNFSKDGTISLITDEGHTITKYTDLSVKNGAEKGPIKMNLKTFTNPEGLEALNGNLYTITGNSGQAIDATGSVIQGAIEMSNVDLSEEFTEMIVTTRAFQAAGKVITTSDELLQEIINLKR